MEKKAAGRERRSRFVDIQERCRDLSINDARRHPAMHDVRPDLQKGENLVSYLVALGMVGLGDQRCLVGGPERLHLLAERLTLGDSSARPQDASHCGFQISKGVEEVAARKEKLGPFGSVVTDVFLQAHRIRPKD